jgi:hypothetical protein
VTPAVATPEATGKPGQVPKPGAAREVTPAVATPETAGKPGQAPKPGVSRVVAPAPAKVPKPAEVSGEEAAGPESVDKAQPEGSGKGKPKQ